MSQKPEFNRNQLARSCVNPFPSFASSTIQRPINAARSVTNLSSQQLHNLQSSIIGQNPFHSRADAAWSDAERERYLNEKRLSAKYKTSLCTDFTTQGQCEWGNSCRFAHGLSQLRLRQEPKNKKTVLCRNFESTGACPYGGRCLFVHRDKNVIFDEISLQTMKHATFDESNSQATKRTTLDDLNPLAMSFPRGHRYSSNHVPTVEEIRARLAPFAVKNPNNSKS